MRVAAGARSAGRSVPAGELQRDRTAHRVAGDVGARNADLREEASERLDVFKQTFGWPTRMPAAEAAATLDDAWAAPAFVGALAAFDQYEFSAGEQLHDTPITIAWGRHDRLLIHARQAPRARRRLPSARHVTLEAGHVPFLR